MAGLGTLAGCAESNVYSIGVDSDQYTVLLPTDPTTAANICTSMYKKANVTVSTLLSMALEGTLEWGHYEKWGPAGRRCGHRYRQRQLPDHLLR